MFLHDRLDMGPGMGLGMVGVVPAVASPVQCPGGIVGAAQADRIAPRRTMLWALIDHIAGFRGLLLARRWPWARSL
ncbi:hypothetical protein AB0N88_26070 [Streptomyces sp. NPDC093516]|uniref:hypothetical protein n=1 Tax=Streptomyces sp. NPDC093516 TaxID=3155304 RepID=UPI003419BDA1